MVHCALSKSAGQVDRKYKYGRHSAHRMQKSTKNVFKSLKCHSPKEHPGQGIEFRCQHFRRKITNSRFCAVKMWLKSS